MIALEFYYTCDITIDLLTDSYMQYIATCDIHYCLRIFLKKYYIAEQSSIKLKGCLCFEIR